VQISMPVDTRRNKRKLRREFRQTGYSAVYLEVSGYPPGKRELGHPLARPRAAERMSLNQARMSAPRLHGLVHDGGPPHRALRAWP